MNSEIIMMESSSLFSLLSLKRQLLFSSDFFRLENQISPLLYKKVVPQQPQNSISGDYPYGSVFNIEFSPCDQLALTVCSNKAIVGYDPRTSVSRSACTVPSAHSDCVNCITFLNDITFATCSDDRTICLWDLRNLKAIKSVLRGHKNWVKNIEYDRTSNKLFSVAFSDGVREWNLDRLEDYSFTDNADNLVIELKDPVRMRIAPDGSKMFISMRQNLCGIIDRFDANSLADCKVSVEKVLRSPCAPQDQDFSAMKSNRPSLHVMNDMNDIDGSNSFRAVMSVAFHPCSDLVALRHIDVKNHQYHQELSTLYDLRNLDESYRPWYPSDLTSSKYLKYIDDVSTNETMDFIKEFCFSRDGRVLASPHDMGVRLFAVDNFCTPMEIYCDSRYRSEGSDRNFEVVNTLGGEVISSPVLSCRFANHGYLLATGAYSGQVLFHKPRL